MRVGGADGSLFHRQRRGRGAGSRLFLALMLLGLLGGLLAGPAAALDFFDKRLEVHGFYEFQFRSIWEDFDVQNDWDVSQMYHVLNVEIEADLLPDGVGPWIDMVSAFSRLEVRYDCVWKRGCNLFDSVNVHGDKTSDNRGKLPDRVQEGRREGYFGTQWVGDTAPLRYQSIFDVDRRPDGPTDFSRRTATRIWNTSTFTLTSQNGVGPDGVRGDFYNPGDDTTWRLYGWAFGGDEKRCLFGSRKIKTGGLPGFRNRDLPWNPRCRIQPRGTIRSYPNPLNPNDPNDAVLGPGGRGTGALPYRPAPLVTAASGNADKSLAQGVYYPNHRLADRIRQDDFDSFDQNYSEAELQWNLGASQKRGEYFLREGYFDIEAFESRLWLRIGKQTIVWGKTELFRNQDRFNPQDLGLSSLPSLEESRIGLWAFRAVWSFWEVGPLEDVRLEGALLFDEFEPADIGRCGEPYAALVVCDKTFGLLVHGVIGNGLAGEIRPDDPWDDASDMEGGARLEWRWDRFSFALTNFYGFRDIPYLHQDLKFERNVDPYTGRPRQGNRREACTTGAEDACLTVSEALTHHSINQQTWSWVCASTVGIAKSILGADECFLALPNSNAPVSGFPLGQVINYAAAGQVFGGSFVAQSAIGCHPFGGSASGASCAAQVGALEAAQGNFRQAFAAPAGLGTVFVPLSIDAGDVVPGDSQGLNAVLSVQQQALVGCGSYYSLNCDVSLTPGTPGGIDLMNAEGSFLLQSWPGIGGTEINQNWFTTNAAFHQPGTVGFAGAPTCTRNPSDGENAVVVVLPGCRGPGEPGYDPAVDGTLTGSINNPAGIPIPETGVGPGQSLGGRAHPFTGQLFKSEGAVVSWNLLMVLVGLQNQVGTPGNPAPSDVFDPANPFRNGACSFAQPQYCGTVQGLLQQTAVQRPTRRAGGNGDYGRHDWLWAGGSQRVLKYDRTNVLGFSMDFAEDRTKSSWNIEYTWENDAKVTDTFEFDQIREVDIHNLTISIDRPTFINFLNAHRTFLINAQFFFRHISGYQRGMTAEGEFNMLATLAVQTGYFNDRLLASLAAVFEARTTSGAFLPQVTYRFTESFSATVGMAVFSGRWQRRSGGISDDSNSRLISRFSDSTFVENGLAPIRDRDELYFRIRYTF